MDSALCVWYSKTATRTYIRYICVTFLLHTRFQNMTDKSKVSAGHDGSPNGVDMAEHPTAKKLSERAQAFLTEVQNLCVTCCETSNGDDDHRLVLPERNSRNDSTKIMVPETNTMRISVNSSSKASKRVGSQLGISIMASIVVDGSVIDVFGRYDYITNAF